MQLSKKLVLRTLAVTVTSAAVLLPASAAFAGGAGLAADPSTGLTNGESVALTGTNFPETAEPVYISECSGLTGAAACSTTVGSAPGDVVIGATAADGSFSANYKVKTGAVGNGTCSSSHACYIEATTSTSTVSTDHTAANTALTPITFAPVPALTLTPEKNVKSGGKIKVHGTGFPAKKTAFVVECAGTPTPGHCDGNTVQTPTTSAGGSFTTTVTVKTETIGGASCKAGGKCDITATTDITGKTPNSSAIAHFTFAKVIHAKTKTSATAANGKVTGKVTSHAKGVKGLKTVLDIRKGSKWVKVATLHTKAGGKFHSSKLKKSGKYEVVTPKQTKGNTVYGGSHSKKITIAI